MADDEPISREQPSVSLDRDRRAYLRIPSDLDATCRVAQRGLEPGWSGRVQNISQGGIGLILQHRFGPGTALLVDLWETGGALIRTLRARVVHATAVLDDGNPCWVIGCVFDQPLDEAEFAALR